MHTTTVASGQARQGTRSLAAESCPISTAIEAVIESNALLAKAMAENRRIAVAVVGQAQEIERQRLALHALATELEERLLRRPRRRRRAA